MIAPHRPLLAGDLLLGTRRVAALLTGRHENVVRRYVQPLACDVRTKALLFDLDAADLILKAATRRYRAAA